MLRPGSTAMRGTREAVLLALLLDAVDDDLAVVLDRGRLVGQAVRDAETAARVEHADLRRPVSSLISRDEPDDDLDGLA